MWKIQTGTKHKEDCKRVFKQYDKSCVRCQELSSGAKPREGWNDARNKADAIRSHAIATHNCQTARCMNVCVAFDW